MVHSNESGTMKLNNYLQSTGQLPFLSWEETTSGLRHEPVWTAVCKLNGQRISSGEGSHKHIAKDIAAERALAILTNSNELA